MMRCGLGTARLREYRVWQGVIRECCNLLYANCSRCCLDSFHNESRLLPLMVMHSSYVEDRTRVTRKLEEQDEKATILWLLEV